MAVTQGMDRRIIGVTWSPNGGMLFLRVQWQASVPSIPPPLGTAKVSGLPIAFKNLTDLFGGPMQEKDPETPPTNTSTIAEPITDKALEKWLYWTPHDPVVYRSEAAGSSPAIRYYATTGPEVDRATAFDPYEGGTDNCGSQMTNLSVLGAAFLNCNGTVSGWMKNNGYADVQLYDGFSEERDRVQRYCDGINAWWARGGGTPSTFRVAQIDMNTSSTPPTHSIIHSANVIINLAKLRKYQPTPPSGRKPDTLTFSVAIGPAGVSGGAVLQGWMISKKKKAGSKQGSDTRVFPVTEINLYPTWGKPGTSSYDPGTPSDAHEFANNPSTSSRIDVTVDFAAFKLFMTAFGNTS